jgi:hypothetical protein
LLFTRNSPLSSFKTDPWRLLQVGEAGRRIARQIGRKEPIPLIAMPHHDNHAWFSFSVSPFGHSDEPVMVAVLDGSGDIGAISLYLAAGPNAWQPEITIFSTCSFMRISLTQGGDHLLEWPCIGQLPTAIGSRTNRLYLTPVRSRLLRRTKSHLNRAPATGRAASLARPICRESLSAFVPIALEQMNLMPGLRRGQPAGHTGEIR